MNSYKNKQTGEFFELRDVDGDVVTFIRQGGGFVCRMKASVFFNENEACEIPSVMRRGFASIDGIEAIYMAYMTDARWNGWAMPWFTKDQAIEICTMMQGFDGSMVFDETEDCVIYIDNSCDEEERTQKFVGQDLETVDGPHHLYPIGDGWCWSELRLKEDD